MVKKSHSFVFILVASVWVMVILFSFISGIRKGFKPPPKSTKKSAAELMAEQKERTELLKQRQKRMLEDQQQRMRDMQRR